MKFRKLYIVSEEELIKKCISGDRRSQKFLYDRYQDVLFPICLRYLSEKSYAEDALMKAFMKIYENMHKFKFNGSFEGWMKRITVNECLMYLRKLKRIKEVYVEDEIRVNYSAKSDRELIKDDILQLIQELPEGYRQIFNLYVIDGFKHREIAQKLNISIHTSKSQLRMARIRLQEMLEDLNYPNIQSYKS